MATAFKPKTQLNLPQENPLLVAIKKRLQEFKTEMTQTLASFNLLIRNEIAAEKAKIRAKLAEIDAVLADVSKFKGKDGKTPTEEDLTKLIVKHIPEPKDGHTPTEQELLKIIKPLIPQVEDGHTPTDDELVRLIKPLIPKPLKGDPGKDGNELTPEEWKQKGKQLPVKEAWFPVGHILGITDLIRNFIPAAKLGGGGGSVEFFTISGTVNGSNTSFTLPKPFVNPVICYNGQVLDPQTHYTISGTALTMTTAPNSGTLFGFGQPA